ncbi:MULTISPECIES: amidase [Paraburkholderia]|uniref:amidase n=1 Tax=Paraburkholderia TaxID=1822464 RepID=UPI00225830CC|nr:MULTISPECIES: amidase [Paraburkholderia]MCX4162850.1 amidase [Paraburkholderia megapolitana]MDN7158345.1 amidase [Paraburkholderia sp. CHISQ3]MDQ6495392.1 amidase [Paraburkholderia megapolitana]
MQRRRFSASLGLLAAAVSTGNLPAGAAPRAQGSSATAAVALRHYLARIAELDRGGPQLRSIIELNPDAATIARTLDAQRRAGHVRGPLHGSIVVVKDNIATGDRMSTSAGSLALDGVHATRDASLIGRLREAGVVIAGKTNLSEWANLRSTRSTSGWSARGGLTRNPYALDRNTSGSSSGSAVAVAAGLADMAVGTETDGSIVSPSSINGVVGLKPTVGRVSRDGIIPISHTQDTAGPIARTVTDVARLLAAMAGTDPLDPATQHAPAPDNYLAALDPHALRGARIGVARNFFTGHDEIDQQIERALAKLVALGAVLVDPVDLPKVSYGDAEQAVLLHEFKHDLPLWLKTFAPHAPVHTLADLIAFNDAHRKQEMPYFGQEQLTQAQALGGLDSDVYLKALATCRKAARDDGMDRVLREHKLDAIVAPTGGTAWLTDFINGDSGSDGFSTPAAVAGYPHLTVPAGMVRGLPIGLSFVGPAWSEARLLALGYAFEQATQWRREPSFQTRTAIPPLTS